MGSCWMRAGGPGRGRPPSRGYPPGGKLALQRGLGVARTCPQRSGIQWQECALHIAQLVQSLPESLQVGAVSQESRLLHSNTGIFRWVAAHRTASGATRRLRVSVTMHPTARYTWASFGRLGRPSFFQRQPNAKSVSERCGKCLTRWRSNVENHLAHTDRTIIISIKGLRDIAMDKRLANVSPCETLIRSRPR